MRSIVDWEFSDIFIVSYPKSGVTWLCLILANILNILKADNRRIDYFSVHDYIPDIHSNPQRIIGLEPPRIIKTHEKFKEWSKRISKKGHGIIYPRVIHLVRDGRDSMVSYFHYINAMKTHKIDLNHFLKNKIGCQDCWAQHTTEWTDNNIIDTRKKHIIQYESLRMDPKGEIKQLMNFIGIDVSDEIIIKSIDLADIKIIQNFEKLYGSDVQYTDKSYMFARKGTTGINEKEYKKITDNYYDQFDKIFKKYNYSK